MTDPRAAYNKPATANAQADNGAGQRGNVPQQAVKKEVQISQTTKEKADAAKEYIESKKIIPVNCRSKTDKRGTPDSSRRKKKRRRAGTCCRRKWTT